MVHPDYKLLFSHPVTSNSSQPHGQQHTRPPSPLPTPKLMSIASVMPSNHLILSVTLFAFCPQSFPASGSFPMSQLFASGDQNTRILTSASVLLMSIQGWFPLRLTGLISLLSKGLSGVFSSTTFGGHQFFGALPSFFFFSFIFISWRLITSQHCSGFCHTLTWISHGVTCIPHPEPPSHLPLHPIPLGLPSAPGLGALPS